MTGVMIKLTHVGGSVSHALTSVHRALRLRVAVFYHQFFCLNFFFKILFLGVIP